MSISTHSRAAQAARTLEQNRSEARSLLLPKETEPGNTLEAFPRSHTFRWLLNHSVGRQIGSALITGALSRLPIGQLISTWIFRRRK